MATVAEYLRQLTGATWKAREVWFRHAKPKDISEHWRIFQAPVSFGMRTNALLFDSSLLATPMRTSDPHLHREIDAKVRGLAGQGLEDERFSQSVLSLIRQGMNAGDVGLETVSRQLAMSRRTLQRRLSQESSSHRKLVQQARQELSRFLLAGTNMNTVEAAYALGFSEPSAFYHAFQEWFGISPQAYRRRQLAQT